MTNTESPNTSINAIDQAIIKKEIGQVAAFIEMARKHLADDQLVDVVELEIKVKSLCDKVNIAGDLAAENIRPAIIKLRKNLDTLDEELSTQFKRLRTSMMGSTRNHAAAAYTKPSNDT